MKLALKEYSSGEVMKIIREWTELNQEEFGRRLGKAKRTISSYENEERNYTINTLYKIAKEFDIEVTLEKKPKRK